MSFSDLEARLNASVMKHVANASARFDGADADVPGDFRNPYERSDAGMGMAGVGPTFRLADADVPPDVQGMRLVIRGTAYVVGPIEPDGTGLTLLILELAL